MKLIADSALRTEANSSRSVNERIQSEIDMRVAALAGHPDRICARLRELDREWDIERCLETGSAALTLSGLVLASTVNRRWLWLSGVVQSFFLQHAIQGWCPPLPVLRGLGVRTQREIEDERHALIALLPRDGRDGQVEGLETEDDRAEAVTMGGPPD